MNKEGHCCTQYGLILSINHTIITSIILSFSLVLFNTSILSDLQSFKPSPCHPFLLLLLPTNLLLASSKLPGLFQMINSSSNPSKEHRLME